MREATWDLMRQKQEQRKQYELIWAKEAPLKISFFLWRVWNRRIATDDNLKKIKIPMYVDVSMVRTR